MRSGLSSETKVSSSTKPVWLLSTAITLSLTVWASSLPLPFFALISTTRTNIVVLLSLEVESGTVTTGGNENFAGQTPYTPREMNSTLIREFSIQQSAVKETVLGSWQ